MDTVTIAVQDKTAPEILALSTHPDRLWPPNNRMVPVRVQVSVKDTCDPQPVCRVTSVSSNQMENSRGGSKGKDWEIVDDLTVKFRAERSGKEGDRIYTLTVECVDQNGNGSAGTTTVTVPHDQGKNQGWLKKASLFKRTKLR